MSSSEELREGNAFSGESSFSDSSSKSSSIDLDDYIEQPEVEITGARQNSPRIGDLPPDQWPRNIKDAPEYARGHQYVEGDWRLH